MLSATTHLGILSLQDDTIPQWIKIIEYGPNHIRNGNFMARVMASTTLQGGTINRRKNN